MLIPFASINPFTTVRMDIELQRLVEKGYRGIKMYPTYQHFYPNDPSLYPLYARAEELQIPVMFHTGSSVFEGARLKYGDPLYLDDVAVDFPKMKIILVHGGRGFWYDRAFFLAKLHANVYMEIAGLPPKKLTYYFPELEKISHKVLFGSDWPGVKDIKHNINIFKSSVSASSIGSSANLNLETQVNNFSYHSSVVYLDLVTDNVALVKENRKYYLVNLDKVKEYLQAKDYIERVKDDCVEMVKLTMPFAVRIDETLIKGLKIAEKALKRCGFELELCKTKAQLVSIPTCLKGSDLASVSGKTFNIISASYKSLEDGICPYSLACAIASFSSKNNLMVLAKDLLTNIESLGVLKNHERAYQEISLSQLAIKFGGGF